MRDSVENEWLCSLILKKFGLSVANCGRCRGVEHLIDAIAARTPEVIANVQSQPPTGFPAPLADAVFDGMHAAAKRLA